MPNGAHTWSKGSTKKWNLSKVLHRSGECLNDSSLTHFHPDLVAQHITSIDFILFKEIQPSELLNVGWTKKNKRVECPAITAFTHRFNQNSFLVRQVILQYNELKHRVEALAFFIKVAKHLHERCNMNGLVAIIRSLESQPIFRLKHTWADLPRKEKACFEKLCELVSSENNYNLLRSAMETLISTHHKCIPFLGIFLSDIVFIDSAYPSRGVFLSNDAQRISEMNNICRMISEFQNSSYDDPLPNKQLEEILYSVPYIEELQTFLDKDQHNLSLTLEPSTNKLSTPLTSPHQKISPSTKRGHRKSQSVGSNAQLFLSNSAESSEINLLDGSVMETSVPIIQSPQPFKDDYYLSDTLDDCLCESSSSDEPINCELIGQYKLQGVLRRKVVRSKAIKKALSPWRRFWVGLIDTHLVMFSSKKSFHIPSLRSHFHSEPCKLINLRSWHSKQSLTPENAHIFMLMSIDQEKVYRFDASNPERAAMWYQYITNATSKLQINGENLIDFGRL